MPGEYIWQQEVIRPKEQWAWAVENGTLSIELEYSPEPEKIGHQARVIR